MTQASGESELFPASDFDQWAAAYDQDTAAGAFPFWGYQHTLAELVRLAEPRPGMAVLDLGTGTGSLAGRFAALDCELWCTDFSARMLEKAREKLPRAHFLHHDLRQPFPAGFRSQFDRIVSAYVFHHFELPEKVAIIERLARTNLLPGGRLVIADISFPTGAERDALRLSLGEQWEEEPYWIAEQALAALKRNSLHAAYLQTSDCAGVYTISGGLP